MRPWRLKACRDEVIGKHKGRVFKLTDDGAMCGRNPKTSGNTSRRSSVDRRTRQRIGINFGNIVVDDANLLDDGMNIAARLEGLAEPGGLCIPGKVDGEARNQILIAFEAPGNQEGRNV